MNERFRNNPDMAAADAAPQQLTTDRPERRPSFSPIRPQRAFEEVCEQIRREVAAGTLRPGDRLPPERELAEQLGVSRTAIREALRSLENAGLVQCQQGMGGGAF
ncbi:MAG TPA: winged helix-turn-helix domain-containing protein, partial [Eoetvoesiella sp.]